MKKLFFFFLLAVIFSFTQVMAAEHPPDDQTIVAALSEYVADGCGVTQDAVQVTAFFRLEEGSFDVVKIRDMQDFFHYAAATKKRLNKSD